jgi:hypothetical protein
LSRKKNKNLSQASVNPKFTNFGRKSYDRIKANKQFHKKLEQKSTSLVDVNESISEFTKKTFLQKYFIRNQSPIRCFISFQKESSKITNFFMLAQNIQKFVSNIHSFLMFGKRWKWKKKIRIFHHINFKSNQISSPGVKKIKSTISFQINPSKISIKISSTKIYIFNQN